MAHDVPIVPAAGLQQGHPGAVPLLAHSGAGLRRAGSQAPQSILDRLARGDRSPADRSRRLKPGTVLLREYQGERHTVTVVANGYVWREATYASLSTIARAITGTAWNGPRFFGLRIDKGTTVSPDAADALREAPKERQDSGIRPRQAAVAQRPSNKCAAVPLHGRERRS